MCSKSDLAPVGSARALTVLAVVGSVGILVTRSLLAQPRDEPLRIEYRVPSGCPTEDDFFALVRIRTRRVRVASRGERARTVLVNIDRGDPETRGHLVIRDPAGNASARDVEGDTCEEVPPARGTRCLPHPCR